jgi:hypothetical protein
VEPLDPVLLAEVLEAITDRQQALERAFDGLNRRIAAPANHAPWCWRALSPAQTRNLFGELRDWVDWVTVRYQLRGETHTIPPCWYRHPVAVEELTALMIAWRGAYQLDQSPPGDGPLHWHDRWLWPTLHRLNTQLRVWAKCTNGTHHDLPPTPPPTPPADFTDFLDQLTAVTTPRAGEVITATEVRTLLDSRHAEAVLPADPRSPIRYRGTWYAIPAGQDCDTWAPVAGDDAATLQQLIDRQHGNRPADGGDGP